MKRTCTALAGLLLATSAGAASPDFGFDTAGRNTAVAPGDDFFRYANGDALTAMQIPADRTTYGSFVHLADLSEQRVHDLLTHTPGTADATQIKLAAFFNSFLNEQAVEKAGAAPMAGDLNLVRAMALPGDFSRLNGLAAKSLLGAVFELDIQPDAKDPTRYAIVIRQSGLGLPDRDYYLSGAFAAKKAQYQTYAAHALALAGWHDAQPMAERVVAFETQLAQASWSRADSRNDDKTYNPTSLAGLLAYAPGFDWRAFFAAADLGAPQGVVLRQNTAIQRIASLVGTTPIDTLRGWAALHLVINASPILSKNFDDAQFAFFTQALQGQPQQRPRWKRAVAATEAAMGDALGREYAALYYPAAAREEMQRLTGDLRQAFHARLEHNSWMSAETRKRALRKLDTFYFQIGAPKKWRDYSGLDVQANDLYGNTTRGIAYDWAFWVGHLGQKVDRDQWQMFPQTVNAYNAPLMNEVVFPAAILQPPFFDPKADPAVNYGGIGGVIGHEMTHSFDDQGRKHDEYGRLTDWWTRDDAKRFEERASAYGRQFAALDLPGLPGLHINPALTEGENIADLGGLTLALDAYHAFLHGKPAPVIDGLTGDQRVFLGWAQVWRVKVRPDRARQALTVDPHSPAFARVDEPTRNIDAWYSAFGVAPGQAMYLAPRDRVRIW